MFFIFREVKRSDYSEIIREKDAIIKTQKEEINQLKRLIFGSKSERFVTVGEEGDQLALFEQEAQQSDSDNIAESKEQINYERSKRKKHPGRHKLPDHLPVEEVTIEPELDASKDYTKIGELVTETLKYKPAQLIIKRIIRPKYIKTDVEKQGYGAADFLVAALPNRPLPKCIAEASLLAHIIYSKFILHLPFYRQIADFKRKDKWIISASTVNDWFIAVCTLLKPLYNQLQNQLLSSNYLQADESPIKVQDQDKTKATHRGYMWVYHAPDSGLVYFQYRKGRGVHGPKETLANFKGYLQTDGYKVYDKIAKAYDLTLLACMAHVRRKFFEAQENDAARSSYVLNEMKKIYAIEQRLKEQQTDEATINKIRKEESLPILNALKNWMEENQSKVLPKSKIGKAINYALLRWDKIERNFEQARFKIDNNLIENQIRPLALGRKNYLFAGSHDGAHRIAMMYSFFACCKANDVNPYEWLKSTIENIADHPVNRLEELLPSRK